MKALIDIGNKQVLVEKGDKIIIAGHSDNKTFEFPVLMTVDGDNNKVGNPTLNNVTVKAKAVEQNRSEKVTSIRYKSKKRVNVKRGHRQNQTIVEITSVETQ